jgi:hypothetical protein
MSVMEYSDYILKKIIVPALVFIGILGNSISIVVFCQQSMRSPFTLLLIALGICDSLFLLARLLIFGFFGAYFNTPEWVYGIGFIGNFINI